MSAVLNREMSLEKANDLVDHWQSNWKDLKTRLPYLEARLSIIFSGQLMSLLLDEADPKELHAAMDDARYALVFGVEFLGLKYIDDQLHKNPEVFLIALMRTVEDLETVLNLDDPAFGFATALVCAYGMAYHSAADPDKSFSEYELTQQTLALLYDMKLDPQITSSIVPLVHHASMHAAIEFTDEDELPKKQQLH